VGIDMVNLQEAAETAPNLPEPARPVVCPRAESGSAARQMPYRPRGTYRVAVLPAVRAPRLPRRLIDVLPAAVLVIAGQVLLWAGWNAGGVGTLPHGHLVAQSVLALVMTATLAWRRVAPLAVVGTVCAAIVVQVLAVTPYVPFLAGLLPMAVANYTAAAYAPRFRAASLVAVFAAEAAIYAVIPEERAGGEVLFAAFVAVGTWLAGDVVRSRFSRAERAVGAAHELLAERERAAAATLAEERSRIARELHDVIAHSVSVMGVQAGAARTLLDADPGAAREALRSIETTARESVAELQRLLAVLRERDDAPDGRAPQPGLAQLPGLVEQVRAAGLPVELSLSGDGEPPPGIALAGYRIVQEALTNALKHAGAPTTVAVALRGGELYIEVRNAAGRRPSPATGGHGLVGMRERAHLYGGTVEAGPCPEGGFAVSARLPVTADVPADAP
jgi:signal transduction histidine kinase